MHRAPARAFSQLATQRIITGTKVRRQQRQKVTPPLADSERANTFRGLSLLRSLLELVFRRRHPEILAEGPDEQIERACVEERCNQLEHVA